MHQSGKKGQKIKKAKALKKPKKLLQRSFPYILMHKSGGKTLAVFG